MDLGVEIIQDVKVVRVGLESLDAGNAREFRAAMEPHLAGATRVVADLSVVQFMDSAGLGALLSVLRQVSANGGDFRLAEPSRAVRSLLQLVRMHRIFSIHNTRDEAIASFAEG